MVPSVGRGKHIWIVMETSIFGACGDIKYATSLLQDVQSFEKLKNILSPEQQSRLENIQLMMQSLQAFT